METILHIQGDQDSPLDPLILVHAVSGLALPYLALGPLSHADDRPVYGISSPVYDSKPYKLPSSLYEVARQYVWLIRREIQPKGPYLLGGWSTGGMIAMKMAEILEEQGETVLHVIMIDSANPETYPPFLSLKEHDAVSDTMYDRVTQRMRIPPSTVGNGDDSNSSSDDEDNEFPDILSQIRKHIHNGLQIVSSEGKHPSSKRLATSATLIKCTSPPSPSPKISEQRKAFVRKTFKDENMGWKKHCVHDFQTLPFGAEHDSVFDRGHVHHLTRLIRRILAQVQL